MSKYKVIVVRDAAVGVFAMPQFVPSLGVAVRAFGDEVKREDAANQLYRHPEDFDLFCIGEYDDETGQVDTRLPEKIASGVDYKG